MLHVPSQAGNVTHDQGCYAFVSFPLINPIAYTVAVPDARTDYNTTSLISRVHCSDRKPRLEVLYRSVLETWKQLSGVTFLTHEFGYTRVSNSRTRLGPTLTPRYENSGDVGDGMMQIAEGGADGSFLIQAVSRETVLTRLASDLAAHLASDLALTAPHSSHRNAIRNGTSVTVMTLYDPQWRVSGSLRRPRPPTRRHPPSAL